MDPQGKVAVISGGASGLGLGLARALVAAGSRVVSLDRVGVVEPVVEGISCDVSDEGSVKQAVTEIVGRHARIDILANCAGIAGMGPIANVDGPGDLGLFARVIATNLMGAAHLTAHAAPLMMRNAPSGEDGERGIVLNTCSIASFQGQSGMGAYTASKAALLALTLVWARDLSAHAIRVMGIAPGFMATAMTAGMPPSLEEELLGNVEFPKRPGTPEEFARLAMFIIENPLLNGDVIRLDGGCRPPARTRWSTGEAA